MQRFDPVTDVINSQQILDDGQWPNFHDAEVHSLRIDRGDIHPQENIRIGTSIELTLELCALQYPITLTLKFSDCDRIQLTDFNQQNAIYDLDMTFFDRGLLRDGSPMTPGIRVCFKQAFGLALSFDCMRIEVTDQPATDSNRSE